ncbi:hypothetical protein Nepgr_032888 [Nepenthes gracilis]|uniref:Protein kinase domain-containing protein n=1 Tax=Nepenthes gracilis TaxID=150966 RepID=A0AAD3TK70_NEPGR|nr:hypothetical protein Nepgr_032888 [Nepenthes gracilis]
MGKESIMKILGNFLVIICVVRRTEGDEAMSFLIICGRNSSAMVDGRWWNGDTAPGNNNFTLSSPGIAASTATFDGDSIYAPLYKTARIFAETSNYTLIGTQANGSYFLRLHFYPFFVGNYLVNESSFDVVADGHSLVSQFNPVIEISRRNSNSSMLVKEFFLTINSNVIVVEFSPSKDSFVFVNAIELVPVLHTLFVDSVTKVGGNAPITSLNKCGIETMYRLNVGGPVVKGGQDSGLWRSWEMDSKYMITANAGAAMQNRSAMDYSSANASLFAPLLVYETARSMSNAEVLDRRFNMSWKFEVDPGFNYLIRLHFCELEYEKPNQRVFNIYINNRTAADNFDIVARAGGKNKPHHQDFFDPVSARVNTLWIQLGPDTEAGAAITDALLNGLEIFKLSHNGNLASVSGKSSLNQKDSRSKSSIILMASMASVSILAVASVAFYCVFKLRERKRKDLKKSASVAILDVNANEKRSAGKNQIRKCSISASRHGKAFTLSEIRAATNDFDESLVIGVGGFGKVYKGEIEGGTLTAIKRANPQSEQGLREFETEIEMLSKLRHRHLVAMIGFCDEKNEMILVYEYMANGTLRSHLFGSTLPPLSWENRLEICIGAARGLHYLHTGTERGIIHRDVKSTNILLDENFVAKMSDFGLSKTGPAFDHTHVSTAVKGSFGYLDPEYFRRQQLTEKSDVYSFGVVLFEVVCARAVINPTLSKGQINLAEWALRWQSQRSLETIIDPHLKGKCCSDSLQMFGNIAEKCLADEGKTRPTMGEILWHLEYVQQLQEDWVRANEEFDRENLPSGRTSRSLGESGSREGKEPSSSDEESLCIDPEMKAVKETAVKVSEK